VQAYLSRSITILQKQESQRAVLMGGQVESVSKVIAHIEMCVRFVHGKAINNQPLALGFAPLNDLSTIHGRHAQHPSVVRGSGGANSTAACREPFDGARQGVPITIRYITVTGCIARLQGLRTDLEPLPVNCNFGSMGRATSHGSTRSRSVKRTRGNRSDQ